MNELKGGAILNYVTIILNILMGLVYTPFLLRMLGQSEYGLYSLAASIISYLTVLDLGFGNAIVRYTAKFKAEGKNEEMRSMFGMFSIIYSFIGIIALVAGIILTINADKLFGGNMSTTEIERTQIMLWLMTFNLAFTFPMSIWGSIMTAYERFIFQRIISIIRSILNPAVMIILLLFGYKAVALVVVTTIFNVATLTINYIYCKKNLKIEFSYKNFKLGLLKEASIYSFWIFLNAIMDRIYWSTGQFILGMYKGAVSVAIYAVAIQIQHLYTMFSTAVVSVFLPKVTSMVSTKSSEKEISDLFVKIGRIQYIIISYTLCAFILLGREFIYLWAGNGYDSAYTISLLFLCPLTVPLIQNLGITILQARNKMKFRSILYIIISLGSLALSIPLTIKYGGIGCAFATSLALTLGQIIIMNIYYYKKQHINIPLFWKEILKMSIVPFIIVVITFLVTRQTNIDTYSIFGFIAIAVIFTIIYWPAFWIFSMNKYEKDLVTSFIIRKRK